MTAIAGIVPLHLLDEPHPLMFDLGPWGRLAMLIEDVARREDVVPYGTLTGSALSPAVVRFPDGDLVALGAGDGLRWELKLADPPLDAYIRSALARSVENRLLYGIG